ncbi:MAG: Fic family protein [Brumimicrobium sp.]|nr:Fic family protein [Brumimicrobium sp.]
MKKIILNSDLLNDYKKHQRYSLSKHFNKLRKTETDTYLFAFTRSSIFSTMIEGSSIDLDNYLFNKETNHQSKEMDQVDDLIKAYEFAKTHAFNFENVLKAHTILSANSDISERYKGKIRDKEVSIRNWMGVSIYQGCLVKNLKQELDIFFDEINKIKKRKDLTYNEKFFYASMAHLAFVNIHPFADGNGRTSRLIEKWVLSGLIQDKNVWRIPSEVNYWIKREEYYKNLRKQGGSYDEINYKKSIDFLLMLPASFSLSKRFYK